MAFVAYVHYGEQSGVTRQISAALVDRGHSLASLCAVGPLEPRHPATGRRRVTPRVALHLAAAAARYGRRALAHRWNTPYAFDVHSRRAGELLRRLARRPDAVLQNGALLSPGAPPPYPYVLLLDHTRALAMEAPAVPAAGLAPPADYGEPWRVRETTVYAGARAIATFSRRVAGSLSRHYGVPASRVHVVGAGANVFPDRVERRDDGETLLFVGRDFRRKGGLVLLAAFEQLRRLRPTARLLVAGPPGRLALPAGATHLGAVSMAALPDLFARTTAFVLPTLREPFGLAYLDAMACGVPCIGSDIEAVPEIVARGETGLLVPPGDPTALAEAMRALLADPARARAMGLAGRERVASRFQWSQVAERLEPVLAAVEEPAAVVSA